MYNHKKNYRKVYLITFISIIALLVLGVNFVFARDYDHGCVQKDDVVTGLDCLPDKYVCRPGCKTNDEVQDIKDSCTPNQTFRCSSCSCVTPPPTYVQLTPGEQPQSDSLPTPAIKIEKTDTADLMWLKTSTGRLFQIDSEGGMMFTKDEVGYDLGSQQNLIYGGINVDESAGDSNLILFEDPEFNTTIFSVDKDGETTVSSLCLSGECKSNWDWTISDINMYSRVSGNIGIGTESPVGKVHIWSGTQDHIVLDGTVWDRIRFINSDLRIANANNDIMTITQLTGNVGVRNTSPFYTLDVTGDVNASNSLCINGDCKFDWDEVGGEDEDWTIFGDNMYSGVTGNVGIGTTSPAEKLHLFGSTNDGSEDLILENYNPGVEFKDRSTGGAQGNYRIYNNGRFTISLDSTEDGIYETDVLTIRNTGRVGIGTVSPGTQLNIQANRPALSIGSTDASNKGIRFEYHEGDEELRIQSAWSTGGYVSTPGTIMTIERDTGKIGIGTTSPGRELDIDDGGGISGTPEIEFNGRAWVGYDGSRSAAMLKGGSGKRIVFDTAGTEKMRIETNGNVGIGTTSPGALLNIQATRPVLSLGSKDGDDKGIRFEYNEIIETLEIQSGGADGRWLSTESHTLMSIDRDTGDIGIGTTAPDAKLSIVTAEATSALNLGGEFSIHDANPQMDFIDSNGSDWAIRVDGNRMYFIRESWNYKDLVLDGTGNIGMGTHTPSAKLDITKGETGTILELSGLNNDVDLRMGYNGSDYGFFWRYEGTGSGNNNDLELWTEGITGDDKQVYNIHQDGVMQLLQGLRVGDLPYDYDSGSYREKCVPVLKTILLSGPADGDGDINWPGAIPANAGAVFMYSSYWDDGTLTFVVPYGNNRPAILATKSGDISLDGNIFYKNNSVKVLVQYVEGDACPGAY